MMRLLLRSRSPIGLLRLLLAGCILLPLALFAVSSWVAYDDAFAEARRGLARVADVAREQGTRLLDEQSDVADQVSDIVRGMSLDDVRNAERMLHTDFAAIVIRRPSVEGVLLAGRDGEPLVSAGTFPVPKRVSVAKTDYFQAIVTRSEAQYITDPQVGSVNEIEFIGLARPWAGRDGAILGVIDVAVLPEEFRYFYGALAGDPEQRAAGMSVALVRNDGSILVHYPPANGFGRKAASDGLKAAIPSRPESGTFEGSAKNGDDTRLFAYRHVQGFPVYVVASRSKGAVIHDWLSTVASHLIFGIPATLGLVVITAIALRRTRQEQRALIRARLEIARREEAEAALLRAQRLEAVGQLTGGVAHDFNNLLTVILGSAEVLTRRPDDAERVRQVAEQIILAARRGGEITQQLLAFSRRQYVNPQAVDLNACLREFEPLLQRASNASIRVELDLGPALAPARIDPGHFQAAVLNLVGNARDAMPKGGVITIATRSAQDGDDLPPELAPGEYLRVRVTDTGTGMDPQTAAKAFEPFFTTKPVGQGTGLGLSQVYGFTKQAGGEVRIITALGEGTTVELLLPRAPEEVAAPAPVPRQPAMPGA
jgi:signal transduction histidine kinase